MLAFVVIKAEPAANPRLGLGNALIGIEVDFLVFEAAPQPLNEDVVHAAALAVHADHHPVPLQCPGELVAGELATLVGIEDLGAAVASERFLECSETTISAERLGHSPRQRRSARPVCDDPQVEEAFGHRDVCNGRAPY